MKQGILFSGSREVMTTDVPRILLLVGLIAALLLFGSVGTTWCAVEETRVTLNCGAHAMEMTYIAFTWNGTVVFEDPDPPMMCGPDGGASILYSFSTPLEIDGFRCDYIADEGDPTQVVIQSGEFRWHIPLNLPCPSPGGTINPPMGMPEENGGFAVVSNRDVLVFPEAACFEFTGDIVDYVAILWYCEGPFEPVYYIYAGCDDPCDDPNCPPAQYADIGFSSMFNPVENIWCRIFWPIGLTQPGCWCYFFEWQLPVELRSFVAEPLVGAVRLNWITASEQDNDCFIIERSATGAPWVEIARRDGQGNSATATHYTYLDDGLRGGVEYHYRLKGVDFAGVVEDLGEVAAIPLSGLVPSGYYLAQNYPNPFNAVTELVYAIAEPGYVRLCVYDLTGRLVAMLADEDQSAGEHRVTFDASDLASGVYIYRLEAGAFVSQQKMVLLK